MVDQGTPLVPVGQRVLSLRILRYQQLATQQLRVAPVLQVVDRVIMRFLIDQA